jgi:hypothetical protein
MDHSLNKPQYVLRSLLGVYSALQLVCIMYQSQMEPDIEKDLSEEYKIYNEPSKVAANE